MIFIIAAGDAEGSVVLTDGEVNTLAPDEEVNAIVEAVDAVQDADGNIVAAWDAEAEDNVVTWCWPTGRAMSSLPARRATPSSKP